MILHHERVNIQRARHLSVWWSNTRNKWWNPFSKSCLGDVFFICYWKLVKIAFIYRKLESMLDTVYCKLIVNALQVNGFQIWWSQLKQWAAHFQTLPFSGSHIQFSKCLLKHVMWKDLRLILLPWPLQKKSSAQTVPPKRLHICRGARYFGLQDTVEKLAFSFSFTASSPFPSWTRCASPVNTCNYTWCHVFLILFFGPKWATFHSFFQGYPLPASPLPAWQGIAVLNEGHLTNLYFWIIFTSHTHQ